MVSIKIYPVLELMDVYYGFRYGWLPKLLEVSDTIVLRPEPKLGEVFRRGVSIKQYLVENYGVHWETLRGLRIMMDHGIFVDSEGFRKIFSIDKTPEELIKLYGVLGVDYGLAYDIPSKLQLDIAIDIAVSRLLHLPPSRRVLKAAYPPLKPYIERVSETILRYIDPGGYSIDPKTVRQKIHRLIQQRNTQADLHEAVYTLSEASIKETLRNLEKQLHTKSICCRNKFTLVPVTQGLYEEHARECLVNISELLMSYDEFLTDGDKKYLYIAIGTGGRVLSDAEVDMINRLMRFAHEHMRRLGVKARLHLLGWSSPRITERLEIKLIYSSDSLSVRRRAVEAKVYVVDSNRIKLVDVSRISVDIWSCECPVCRDSALRTFVLDPSGKRRNDARIAHNLWVIKKYISLNC